MDFPQDRPTFGLQILKYACLLFCLTSVLTLAPGVHSISSSRFGVFAVSHDHGNQILSLVQGLLFGLGFYGLHRRLAITWKFGGFLLGVLFLEWLGFSLASTLKLPDPDRWIASAIVAVGGSAVAVYWGLWWKRQKGYFLSRS